MIDEVHAIDYVRKQNKNAKEEVNNLNVNKDDDNNVKSLDLVIRTGKTFIKLLVDTGSPSSFLNRQTANKWLQDPTAKVSFIPFQDLQLSTMYLD